MGRVMVEINGIDIRGWERDQVSKFYAAARERDYQVTFTTEGPRCKQIKDLTTVVANESRSLDTIIMLDDKPDSITPRANAVAVKEWSAEEAGSEKDEQLLEIGRYIEHILLKRGT